MAPLFQAFEVHRFAAAAGDIFIGISAAGLWDYNHRFRHSHPP